MEDAVKLLGDATEDAEDEYRGSLNDILLARDDLDSSLEYAYAAFKKLSKHLAEQA